MKKFLVKFFIFSFLILLIYSILSFVPSSFFNNNTYIEAIIDKHEYLDSLAAPRLILAGGSNIAFGIDSERLEEEFNIPVVNLSLMGGVGFSFMLNELKYSADTGDIVLLSPEYFLDDGSPRLKQKIASVFPPAENYLYNGFLSAILGKKETTKKILQQSVRQIFSFKFFNSKTDETTVRDSVYTRTGFNKRGDIISHLTKKSPKSVVGRKTHSYKYWKGIEAFNQFKKFADTKNIRVFYIWPSYMESEYIKNEKVIEMHAADINRDLETEILSDPEDFVYPDSLFFDTVYHLNREGRIKRTEDLIRLIKANPVALNGIKNIPTLAPEKKIKNKKNNNLLSE